MNKKTNRRSSLKNSVAAPLTGSVLAGLINTPGVANANTTQPGTTAAPAYTITILEGIVPGAQTQGVDVNNNPTWQHSGSVVLEAKTNKPAGCEGTLHAILQKKEGNNWVNVGVEATPVDISLGVNTGTYEVTLDTTALKGNSTHIRVKVWIVSKAADVSSSNPAYAPEYPITP